MPACSGPASVVFDPTLTEYDFGPSHPMSPVRVDLTMRLARELGVLEQLRTVPAPETTTLHLVSTTQKNIGFFPKGAPRQGDRLGFGDKITGDDTGYDRAVCTFVGGKSLLCTIQVQLSKGTLTVQGMVPQKSTNTPIAITGGTGAYDGARGTALVTDVSKTQTKVDVNLLP